MNRTELARILELHELYLQGSPKGARADLSGANLSGADLSGADLTRANLPYPIYQAYLGQYHMHTNAEYIRIGCKYMTVREWLEVTQEQAEQMGLNSKQYSKYMDFIKWYNRELTKENTHD